jgi:hypothetical protein
MQRERKNLNAIHTYVDVNGNTTMVSISMHREDIFAQKSGTAAGWWWGGGGYEEGTLQKVESQNAARWW